MSVFIITKKAAALSKVFGKVKAEISAPAALAKFKGESGDMVYLDISGLAAADLKKNLSLLKKKCKAAGASWGIVDPRGKDPAAWFFEGAADYLGPDSLKTALTAARIKTAVSWRAPVGSGGESVRDGKAARGEPQSLDPAAGSGKEGIPKRGIKLPPANQFAGWKGVTAGKTFPFYLLYCSLEGKTNLASRLGEAAYSQMHKRFLAFLYQNFQEADGQIWMESGRDCLFLIPPRAKNIEAAVKACLRLLISAPLIVIETLGLTVPANFVFALHYGSVNYQPPGKTGTVVSDAVNFIFHLGAKQAEQGRLTVSGDTPDETVPAALNGCFRDAGEYEGRRIWHTRKFSYSQPWT